MVAYLPAAHVPHVEASTAADALEAFPAAQESQRAAPVVALYCPVPHAVHEPPSDPVCPWLHVQLVAAPLAPGEFELAGHGVHVFEVAATTVEYVPPSQDTHDAGPTESLYHPTEQLVHA
jgi:hypothetical protein